jgi:hypothetical protein
VLANVLFNLPGALEIFLYNKGVPRLDRVRCTAFRLMTILLSINCTNSTFPSLAESFLRVVFDPRLHGGLSIGFLPPAEVAFDYIRRLFW